MCASYLRLADPLEVVVLALEPHRLRVDGFVVPVAEQHAELAGVHGVLLERVVVPVEHDQRPVQPGRPLHPEVAVVEVRPGLRRRPAFQFIISSLRVLVKKWGKKLPSNFALVKEGYYLVSLELVGERLPRVDGALRYRRGSVRPWRINLHTMEHP